MRKILLFTFIWVWVFSFNNSCLSFPNIFISKDNCENTLSERKINNGFLTKQPFNLDSIYNACQEVLKQRLGNCNINQFVHLNDTFNVCKCGKICIELQGTFSLPEIVRKKAIGKLSHLEVPKKASILYFICMKNGGVHIRYSRFPFCKGKKNCALKVSFLDVEKMLNKKKLLDPVKYSYSITASFEVMEDKSEGLFWKVVMATNDGERDLFINMQTGKMTDTGFAIYMHQ